MKNNIMKKWVKALRSGKYKQGTGTLKQYNRNEEAKHCCLGVLCQDLTTCQTVCQRKLKNGLELKVVTANFTEKKICQPHLLI